MEYVISAIWSALELLCVALFNGAFLVKKTEKKRCGNYYNNLDFYKCIYIFAHQSISATAFLTVYLLDDLLAFIRRNLHCTFLLVSHLLYFRSRYRWHFCIWSVRIASY